METGIYPAAPDMTTGETEPVYRWYVLALGISTHIFVAALPWTCMPVLFPEIAADMGLNLVQVGMIWGIINIPVMFVGIFGGMLSDTYGTSRVLALCCLLSGITCAMRGMVNSYTGLLMITVIFGIMITPIAITTHKAAVQWFSPKQLGLANGLLAMGMGAGNILAAMISATVLSPLLGGWRNVMYIYGAISIVFALLWFQTRNRPIPLHHSEGSMLTVNLKEAILHVIRLKPVWIIAATQLCICVCRSGVGGYLPTYLEDIGWSTMGASGAVSAMATASVIGVIPLSMFSDRVGLRKAVLIPMYLITAICAGMLSITNTTVIWLMVILIGLFQEAMAAITITLTMEMDGVGVTYSGTALGIKTMTSAMGGLVGPPTGNRLAMINPTYGYIFWSMAGVISTILFFLVKETGWRRKYESLRSR